MHNDPFAFCQVVCTKIAYYISKIYDTDIYRMEAEFLKDDDGRIYLHYAKDIIAKNYNEDAIKMINPEMKMQVIMR